MNRYSIKIVSEIIGFFESTLRYYEKVGLWGECLRKLEWFANVCRCTFGEIKKYENYA